jgi:hypothetical protein
LCGATLPPRSGARGVAGWAALRDVPTTLSWSGVLGESGGAWFGVLFVWAPNGVSHGWRHHGSPPSPRARAANEVLRALWRNCDDALADRDDFATLGRGLTPSRLRHFVAGSDPIADRPASPSSRALSGVSLLSATAPRQTGPRTNEVLPTTWVGPLSATASRQTGPPSRRQRTTSQPREQPTRSLSSMPTDHAGTPSTV